MNLRKLSLLLALVTAGAAQADDGWWSTAGGIGHYGRSHPSIRMVSEDLKIQIKNDYEASFDVTFVFRNEGPATTAKMAFPESYQLRVGEGIDHFRTWIDGKPTKPVRKALNKLPKVNEEYGDFEFQAVWLKNVAFKAGQTRRVRVMYNAGLSGDTSGSRHLSYTLTTGATWKGSIGDCRISVSWPNLRKLSAPYPNLPPAKWQYPAAGQMTTRILNWEPKDDLKLDMSIWFWNFWINGKRLPNESFSEVVHGSASDPLFRTTAFGAFFGGALFSDHPSAIEWGPGPLRWFGGPFTVSKGVLTLGSGRKMKLRRGSKKLKPIHAFEDDKPTEFVYLKDVVEALSGRFTYDSKLKQVRLTFR